MKIRIDIIFLVVCCLFSLFLPNIVSLPGAWLFMYSLSGNYEKNPLPVIITAFFASSIFFTPLGIFPLALSIALLFAYGLNILLKKQSFGVYLSSIVALISFLVSMAFFSGISTGMNDITIQIPVVLIQTLIAGCLGITFRVIMNYYERKHSAPAPKATA